MYSQLKPFSLMGMSNSEILLSENHDLEFNFLVRPALEFEDDCEIAPSSEDSDGISEDHKQEQQEQEQEEANKCKFLVSTLKIKLPTEFDEFKIINKDVENNEDGLKTPTCLEKRIPLVLQCPPAPRKPKTKPNCNNNKRKSMPTAARSSTRRVLLDLSNEIESLFPPSFVVGGKIKKVRPQ